MDKVTDLMTALEQSVTAARAARRREADRPELEAIVDQADAGPSEAAWALQLPPALR